LLASASGYSADSTSPYSFRESVELGVIDFVVNPWVHPDIKADVDEIDIDAFGEELARYATERGISLSFSGEPKLAREMALDSVYIPARFYIEDFDREYRNRVSTEFGAQYTYVLSPLIVQGLIREVTKRTGVLFYVDNFDSRQDDLRRMMELDGPNRRELIQRSGEVAARHGATFVPSYSNCDGCVPLNLVGDSCKAKLNSKLSVYNARECGDLEAIRETLAAQR
jgi:hypothetical protein